MSFNAFADPGNVAGQLIEGKLVLDLYAIY